MNHLEEQLHPFERRMPPAVSSHGLVEVHWICKLKDVDGNVAIARHKFWIRTPGSGVPVRLRVLLLEVGPLACAPEDQLDVRHGRDHVVDALDPTLDEEGIVLFGVEFQIDASSSEAPAMTL